VSKKPTQFQKKVWKAIDNIPFGHTITYKQLAESIGNLMPIGLLPMHAGKTQNNKDTLS
jgi:Methylated DNA-protein cysteine methyltransferase